ncbi:MAG: MarR family transcriptional regulator [Chloroflexota bacterium]
MTVVTGVPSLPASAARRHAAPLASETRAALADDLIDELAGWSPPDRLRTFTKWHQGSLSLVQLIVLTVLEAHGPLQMSRLAEALDVSDASATGIVDRMEKRGLVGRRHDADDRRVVIVSLADGGSAVFRDHKQLRRGRLATLVDRLSDDELAGLLTGLRGLRAAIVTAHAEAGAAVSPLPTTDDPATSPGGSPVGSEDLA